VNEANSILSLSSFELAIQNQNIRNKLSRWDAVYNEWENVSVTTKMKKPYRRSRCKNQPESFLPAEKERRLTSNWQTRVKAKSAKRKSPHIERHYV
jgi:hypothetical protein